MTCGVYEIVNTVNGKRYVGSSVNIEQRWSAHKSNLRRGRHHSIHLQRAWDKYGEHSFTFSVIYECDLAGVIEAEQVQIDIKSEYNIAPIAGRTYGVVQSDESNKLRSESCKSTLSDPAIRKKISDGVRLAMKRPDYIANMSEGVRIAWSSPHLKDFQSKRVSGKGNPNHDATLYTFVHGDHGERNCTQYDLRQEFPHLRRPAISQLVSGKQMSTMGWKMKKAP